HRRPVGIQPGELERLDATRGDHALDHLLGRGETDPALDEPELVRDLADRAYRARGADRPNPAEAPERRDDGPQLQARGEPRAVEALLAELAAAEMPLRQLDAADRQALQ